MTAKHTTCIPGAKQARTAILLAALLILSAAGQALAQLGAALPSDQTPAYSSAATGKETENPAGPAGEALKVWMDQILAVVADPKYKAPGADLAEAWQRIRSVTRQFFDYQEFSRLALGPAWLKFTPQEQSRFVALFTEVFDDSYLARVRFFESVKTLYGPEKDLPNGFSEVDTLLLYKSSSSWISYFMKKGDSWRTFDVAIEGVSLVGNYRSQFQAMLDTSSDAAFARSKENLFSTLEKKILELKAAGKQGKAKQSSGKK